MIFLIQNKPMLQVSTVNKSFSLTGERIKKMIAGSIRNLLLGFLLGILILTAFPSRLSPAHNENHQAFRENLKKSINSCLNTPKFSKVRVGIKIATLDGNHVLFQRNPEISFIPASITKIITSGIALAKFGPHFKFETYLLAHGELENGILKGSLYLKGKGDPTLRHHHLLELAKELKGKPLNRIEGDIVYDISFLDQEQPRYPPNARHLYAPPCALTLNYNWIPLELKVGPPPELRTIPQTAYARLFYDVKISPSRSPGKPTMIYQKKNWGDYYTVKGNITRWDRRYQVLRLCVSRPGLFTSTVFRECLQAEGIMVTGHLLQDKTPENARVLSIIRTQSLGDITRTLNCESNNVIAELLNKNLGAYFDSIPGNREKGLGVMNRYCQENIGLENGQFFIADASGLSPRNRFSPGQMIQVLVHFYSKLGKEYYSTLAPQGHHPHAMNPVPPRGIRMFVKSGTLPASGVNTVAGYIFDDEQDRSLAFCVMANRRGPGPMAYSGTYTIPILKAIVAALGRKP